MGDRGNIVVRHGAQELRHARIAGHWYGVFCRALYDDVSLVQFTDAAKLAGRVPLFEVAQYSRGRARRGYVGVHAVIIDGHRLSIREWRP